LRPPIKNFTRCETRRRQSNPFPDRRFEYVKENGGRIDALVLDVKTGSGAFMQKIEDAQKLATALCQTGNAFGVRCEAVISDMNQPLGKSVGNAMEVYECVKILRGEADDWMQPTLELSVELAARILILCAIEKTIEGAKLKVRSLLDSGVALEKFRMNVEYQKGRCKDLR
jgi:thymidine phosphorylase